MRIIQNIKISIEICWKTQLLRRKKLSERHIYEELLRCKLTPEELKTNSYPLEGSKPGYAICTLNFELKYNAHYLHIKKLTGNRRYCVRCSKEYEVHPVTLKQYIEGPDTCSYHPGKKKSGGTRLIKWHSMNLCRWKT